MPSDVVNFEAHELNLDYLRGEDGKLATIKYVNINCVSPELVLYEDNHYELFGEVSKCNQELCNYNLEMIDHGHYQSNVLSMFGLVSAQKLDDYNKSEDWIRYTLTTGKGDVFISNDSNIPLNTLLEEIHVNLKTCSSDIQQ